MERFLDYFVPERYKLDLSIDKFKKSISGSVEVFGEVRAETVKFHAVKLEVEGVEIDGKNVKPDDYKCEEGVLTLFKVPRNASSIKMRYHGSLSENMIGAYLSTYKYEGKTEVIVATQFESHFAREAFPCIDEPAAKAVFELAITTDKDDMVLANTPQLALRNAPNQNSDTGYGYRTTRFEPTPKMSTYLLAWVIGKFHGKTTTNRYGVEVTTYAALNQDIESVEFANETAARALEYFNDNFGVKYPLPKCTQVALPDFEAGAMENWGLVTYRESMLLANKNATLDTKKGVALTVTHELSHQWFGDLVTMSWWDDLWLNESFASIMEYYATDFIYPEFKIWEGFFTGDALAALKRDCLSGVQPVHQDVNDPAEISTLFDPAIVYAKGARLILMVIRAMGWDKFCLGVRDYFEKFKYSNTVGDDLWTALKGHAGFDVGVMMHDFIDQPGYPVITSNGEDFNNYTQRRFLLDAEMLESNWLLPEISEDMSGHYILNLSEEEFNKRLARFDKLGLEEKLRLLIDRDLLAKAGMVEMVSLLPLIEKFRNEHNAAVWSILTTIINGISLFFEHDSPMEKKYKKFVRELTIPLLSEIGLVTRESDDENTLRLRSILLALNYFGEDKERLQELAKMYDQDYTKLDPEIRDDILDAKLYLEPEFTGEYLEAYSKTADAEIKYDLLFAVTLVRDKKQLEKVMELLNKPEIVKPQDLFHLFLYLYRNFRVKTEVLDWAKRRWEYIKKISGDKSLENYPRYTAVSVRNEKEYKGWLDCFGMLKDDPALARAMEMGQNEIEARLKMITKNKAAVEKWVSEY